MQRLISKKMILFPILFWAGILRLTVITKEVWYDEALSIYIARQPLRDLFLLLLNERDQTLPLFPILLHFLSKISSSEIWLRILPLTAGVLTIYAVYKLGKLIFNEFVGLLSCLLVAFSENLIYYSVELRTYSIWILFCLASVYFFIKSIESPSLKNFFFYVIFTTLCVYAHYFSVFLLVVELLIYFLYKNKLKLKLKLWLSIFGCILILSVPLIIYAFLKFQRFLDWGQLFYRPRPAIKDFFEFLISYSDHISIFYLFFLILGLGIASRLKTILSGGNPFKKLNSYVNLLPKNYKLSLVFLYFIIPILSIFFIYINGFSLFYEYRYILPYFIIYYFIIAACIYAYKSKRLKESIVTLLVLITFFNSLRYCIVLRSQPRFGLKEVAEIIKPRLGHDDVVAVGDIYKFVHIFNYLNRRIVLVTTNELIKKHYVLRTFEFNEYEVIMDLDLIKDKKRLWLILERNKNEEHLNSLLAKSSKIKLKETFSTENVEIRLYDLFN